MKNSLPLLFLALVLPACGGSGSQPIPASPSIATAAPSAAPGASASPKPSTAPSTAPSASPALSSAPTAAPTASPVPIFVLQAAPLTSTPTILAEGRRAQSSTSLLPLIVEGAGFTPGPLAVWVTNAVAGLDVAETTGSVTGAAFAPLACPGASTLWCAVHPLAWEMTPPTGLATGKHALAVAFGDGTTGIMTDDVFDSWTLTCNTGWAYVGGAIVPQPTRATSDIYDDCIAGNIVLVRGGLIITNPVADSFGRTETVMPTITAAFIVTSLFTNAPAVGIQPGIVFGINTQDGGFAKVYFTDSTHGLALHAQADGSYAF